MTTPPDTPTADRDVVSEDHVEATRQALERRHATSRDGVDTAPQHVPVNMYETDSALVIVAPLPAVMPEDIEVLVTPGHVRIDARLRSSPQRDHLLQEWTYGPYHRTVDIPTSWGASGQASLANGQLAIRLLRGEPGGEGAVVPVRPDRVTVDS